MNIQPIGESHDFETVDGLFKIFADNKERGAYRLMIADGAAVINDPMSLDDCKLALRVIYYFVGHGVNRCKQIHCYVSEVARALGECSDVELNMMISVLSTAGFIKKTYSVLFDEEEGDEWILAADEYAEAAENGVIAHPRYGSLYQSDEFYLCLAFKPTDKLIQLADYRENNKPDHVKKLISEIKRAELAGLGYSEFDL